VSTRTSSRSHTPGRHRDALLSPSITCRPDRTLRRQGTYGRDTSPSAVTWPRFTRIFANSTCAATPKPLSSPTRHARHTPARRARPPVPGTGRGRRRKPPGRSLMSRGRCGHRRGRGQHPPSAPVNASSAETRTTPESAARPDSPSNRANRVQKSHFVSKAHPPPTGNGPSTANIGATGAGTASTVDSSRQERSPESPRRRPGMCAYHRVDHAARIAFCT
jgi:hypothetical protein